MPGIVLNADCIVSVCCAEAPSDIYHRESAGVTRGQGQVPRVRLGSRLKCSEKLHTAARDEKYNNVDMAFPL